MGWKIVRDGNEAWCRKHGVSGQWRKSPDPESALLKKIFEEAGEYVENRDPEELYDLLEVVHRLLAIVDRTFVAAGRHSKKVALMGKFTELIEWTPVPSDANVESSE